MRCVGPIFLRKQDVYVPCGKCGACLSNRRSDWIFRLGRELSYSDAAHFVTLTYADEFIPHGDGCYTLAKADLRNFLKRYRHSQDRKIRYYAVGEYGGLYERPHYHLLLFNGDGDREKLLLHWKLGLCHVGDVSAASIAYVASYIMSLPGQDYTGRAPPFSVMSRNPGIGFRYVDRYRDWHVGDLRNYTLINGRYGRLPRYYRERIFDREQRTIIAGDSVRAGMEAEEQEIERLRRLHPNPYFYYQSALRYAADAVIRKALNAKKK